MCRRALLAADPEWESTEQYRATTGAAWGLVLAAAALDVATTWAGLAMGLPELNPVAAAAVTTVETGSALVGLKLAGLSVAAAGWWVTPPPSRLAVPVAIGLLWLTVGLSNAAVLVLN